MLQYCKMTLNKKKIKMGPSSNAKTYTLCVRNFSYTRVHVQLLFDVLCKVLFALIDNNYKIFSAANKHCNCSGAGGVWLEFNIAQYFISRRTAAFVVCLKCDIVRYEIDWSDTSRLRFFNMALSRGKQLVSVWFKLYGI